MKIQHDLEPIRFSGEKPKLKQNFVDRFSELLGSNYDSFVEYTYSYLNRSIRVNTTKIEVDILVKRLEAKDWVLEKIPWINEGFWVRHKEGRRDLGNTMEHQLGYFYIQEAASMIPPIALDPKQGDSILDCCASPGSKTTQIAEMIKDDGIVVANDLSGIRMAPLGSNVQRLGLKSILQIQTDFLRIPETEKFDKILLDAPCSGSGTIRKSIKTIDMWNPKMLVSISKMQKRMIRKAWALLKPGGILVYSTCSIDPEENEAVINDFILNNADAKIIPFKLDGFKTSSPIMSFAGENYDSRIKDTLRVWPQDNDTEGFFVAKLGKSSIE